MNTKQVLSALLLIAVFVVGCKPENYTGSTVSNTPVSQQTLRLSEPVKVQVTEPTINLERSGQSTLVGNVLIANTSISNTNYWASIDLDNGQAQSFHATLYPKLPATNLTRYIARIISHQGDTSQRLADELSLLDLQQGKEFIIASNSPNFPVVAENVVAWQGLGNKGWGIYSYDITTGQLVTITDGIGTQAYPRVSGDWIIYLDMAEKPVLHAYHLATKENLTLGTTAYPTADYGKHGKYHLVGAGKVAWADADTYRLHVFDLNTRTTEILPETLTRCQPLYWLESMVEHTLLYAGCEGWALYDLDSKTSATIPVFPPEIQARMTQSPNEDATYSMGWIVMSETRLAWTVIDGLGHSWLYTSQIER